VQYDGVGNVVNSFSHVKNGFISDLVVYDCTKIKPGSTVRGSMCVIEAKTASIFYLNPILGLVAEGTADLRLIENEFRKLQSNIGRNDDTTFTDGKYSTSALLSRNVDLFSDAAILSSTRLSLFLSVMLISFALLIEQVN